MLCVQASQAKEEVLLPGPVHAAEEARQQLQYILGAVHFDQQSHCKLKGMPARGGNGAAVKLLFATAPTPHSTWLWTLAKRGFARTRARR